MKFSSLFYRRVHWLNLPAGILMALLQRTPVLRVLAMGEELVASSPMGAVLKSAAAVAASLGAMHSLAGATQLFVSPSDNPAIATVGVAKTILFTVTGAPVAPGSWVVSGPPPGMTFSALNGTTFLTSGTINASTIQVSGTPTTAGTYTMSLRAFEFAGATGDTINYSYNVVVSAGTTTAPPTVVVQPQSVTVAAGSTVGLTVSGTSVSSFQWQKNGANIAGATSDTLILTSIAPSAAGSYTAVLTNAGGSVTSSAATVAVSSGVSRISNLSVRTTLGSGQGLTVGFVTNGPKSLLVRAVGPTMGSLFNIPNFFADPKVTIVSQSNVTLGTNDDWPASLSAVFASLGAFPLAAASKDAAILQSPINGPATAQISGTGSGVMLVEVYDQDGSNSVRLTNVSARNQVGTGADILISGFVVVGPVAKTVLIRGIGPALKDVFNIGGALTDPKLELYNQANVKIGENDNWNSSLGGIFAQVGAYAFLTGSKDSALLITLPPGLYTAQVSGVSSVTGDGVVEVYEVP